MRSRQQLHTLSPGTPLPQTKTLVVTATQQQIVHKQKRSHPVLVTELNQGVRNRVAHDDLVLREWRRMNHPGCSKS